METITPLARYSSSDILALRSLKPKVLSSHSSMFIWSDSTSEECRGRNRARKSQRARVCPGTGDHEKETQGCRGQKQVQRRSSNRCPWMGYFHKKLTNLSAPEYLSSLHYVPSSAPFSPAPAVSLILVNKSSSSPALSQIIPVLVFCVSSLPFLAAAGVRTEFNLFIVQGLFIAHFLGKIGHLFIPLTSPSWPWVGRGLSDALKTNLLSARESQWRVFPAFVSGPSFGYR